ncbi:patatin-like phospholipase family protein [Pyxidicoccus sp. MSG2]|uniref:patatin-like phospholipase family protein n=1 Tax=Pyxidicoccus sp. MSG2 TaxID=2996790 RepID=UPI00227122FB|nr:patatin-like phospholipase family protein [Pyxidicoccus sp. MSG2]MCY1016020.1 patatin-like phospholipase family protein [Pyxidicoccus sp. MSG2]
MASPTLHQLLDGKRFGLVLSAGYFGFYGHAGFLKGLAASGLKPQVYAGTSAGGMVAAYAAAGIPVHAIEELVLRQTRANFWDPDPIGAVLNADAIGHGMTGLLKGERFRRLLEDTLAVRSFEDLPHPLLLVASNLTLGRHEVFTSGELAPRVHATCAYPGLFRAVPLEGNLYWDGGLVDKAPALSLNESAVGKDLDAILVHFLPSRTRKVVGGPMAYAQGLASGSAALRRDHFRLQLTVLEQRQVPVYVVVSNLPPVTPTTMERGFDALDQARLSAERALARPPVPFAQAEW